MAGNILYYYKEIEESKYFNLPSRIKIGQFLKQQNYYEPVEDLREMKAAITHKINKKTILGFHIRNS